MTNSPARQIQRAVYLVGAMTLALVAAVCVLGVLGYFSNHRAVVALCALRADVDQRISSSQDFLDKHPNGIPGLPAKVIQQSLSNAKRTRASLSVLNCGGKK